MLPFGSVCRVVGLDFIDVDWLFIAWGAVIWYGCYCFGMDFIGLDGTLVVWAVFLISNRILVIWI